MTNIFSCTNVLAKKNESLESHTKNALNFLKKFFSWQEKNIEEIGKIESTPVEEIKSRLFVAVYLHDIGKATPEFQEYIHGKRKSCLSHALLSIPFALSACEPLNDIRYEALAIMSHHTPFYNRLYRSWREKKIDEKNYLPFAVKNFYKTLPFKYEKIMKHSYPFKFKEKPQFGLVGKILNEAQNGLDFYPLPTIRDTFSLFVTALRYSDWLASGNINDYSYSTTQIEKKLETTRRRKKWEWENFQRRAMNAPGNVFIRIPTGKGKTEAALLWANKNLDSGKLLYLLPTRVTTNAMFSRLLQTYKFKRGDIGISHGSSSLIIAEKEKWEKSGWSKHLFSSTFITPITVATVDQLLLTLFNWYYWELLESNAKFSAIVFDEIHAYDIYTSALILNLVKKLRGHGTKFAFMSATLPQYLFNALQEIIGESQLIDEPNYDALIRHRVHFIENKYIQDAVEDILKTGQRRKVLVIADTIKKAKDIYRALREKTDNVMLFHSMFIEKDRRRKEKMIKEGAEKNGGFIAVTTQVVEVSLDIDYDILYTEVAPIDALVQRMGRVNRKGKKGIVDVFIFKADKNASLVYGAENLEKAEQIIAKIDSGKISVKDTRNLVNEQYPTQQMCGQLKSECIRLENELADIQSKLWHVQTIQLSEGSEPLLGLAKTRAGERLSVEGIPYKFKNIVKKLKYPTPLNFLVRVPLGRIRERFHKEDSWIYFDVNYDSEYGIDLGKGGESETII